jgi:hypothetical protein
MKNLKKMQEFIDSYLMRKIALRGADKIIKINRKLASNYVICLQLIFTN